MELFSSLWQVGVTVLERLELGTTHDNDKQFMYYVQNGNFETFLTNYATICQNLRATFAKFQLEKYTFVSHFVDSFEEQCKHLYDAKFGAAGGGAAGGGAASFKKRKMIS